MTLCFSVQRSTPYGTWREVSTVCRIASLSLVPRTLKEYDKGARSNDGPRISPFLRAYKAERPV